MSKLILSAISNSFFVKNYIWFCRIFGCKIFATLYFPTIPWIYRARQIY